VRIPNSFHNIRSKPAATQKAIKTASESGIIGSQEFDCLLKVLLRHLHANGFHLCQFRTSFEQTSFEMSQAVESGPSAILENSSGIRCRCACGYAEVADAAKEISAKFLCSWNDFG
jgi:hypothetical protein